MKAFLASFFLLAFVTIQTDAAACNTGPCPTLKYTNTNDRCTVDAGAGTCVCTDLSCTCADGYTLDGASGSATCKMTKPTVTGSINSLNVPYGNSITLTCNKASDTPTADVDNNGYAWYVGGTAVSGQTGQTYAMSNVDQNREVRCSMSHSSEAHLNSPQSDTVTVTVVANNAAQCSSMTACNNAQFSSGTCSVSAAGVCTCDNNQCVCNSNYILYERRCRMKPNGMSCSSNANCDAANTADQNADPYGNCNSDTGVCNCAPNFYVNGGSCVATGRACTTANANTQCNGAAYAGTCDSTGHCDCANSYMKIFGDCSTAMGKPCTTNTAWYDCNGDRYSGVCTNSRCECANNGEQVIGDCNGVPAVVGSFLLMVAAALVSRLF